jgi:tetratricopeptide (TPR) repeat protein
MQPRSLALARIDARLRGDPTSLELALDRARILADIGHPDDAQKAYLAVLARAPDDLRALTDFGAFLLRAGFRSAARTVLERALAIDPACVLAHANLGHVLFAETEYAAARGHYEAALALDPAQPSVHQGLSYALTRLGLETEAAEHRRLGFAGRAVTTAPYRGTAPPIDVLLVVCAAGGSIYTETFLDDRIFRTTTLVADADAHTDALPRVDVIFNAISDADRNRDALLAMARVLEGAEAPVLNDPQRVLLTARAPLAARLAELDGIVAPRVVTVPLAALREAGSALVERAGFSFPVLVRAPGFHTGQHFVRVDASGDVRGAIAEFPGGDVLLMAFAETRADDGRVRKYRMMAIGDALYPLHVAVSRHWKVHYFTAEMASDAANRAEDERFLADPAGVLGAGVMETLERVRAAVGLDYMGIDFGIDRAGRVVVFEANATMIVLPPGTEPMWTYRRVAVRRIVDAVQRMLGNRQ